MLPVSVVSTVVFETSNLRNFLPQSLVCSNRASNACRRFISVHLATSPVATERNFPPGTLGIVPSRFRSDPESLRSPGIDLPGDRKILSLLIRANTGSGSETQESIHLS